MFDEVIAKLDVPSESRDCLMVLFYEKGLYLSLLGVLLSGENPDYLTSLNMLLRKIRSREIDSASSRELNTIFMILYNAYKP